MKVLQITSDYPPNPLWGMGWHVHSLVEALKKDGHEVVLATAVKSKNYHEGIITTSVEQDRKYLSEGRYEIFNNFDNYNDWQIELAKQIESKGLQFDVIHSHNWMSWLTAKYLKNLNPSTKVITSFHFLQKQYELMAENPIPHNHDEIIEIETEAVHTSDAVIVLSSSQKDLLLSKYDIKEKRTVRIVPYGIEFNPVSYQSLLEQKESNKYIDITFAGRIENDKGIWQLIRAFLGIKNKYKMVRLNVIGKGPLLEELQSMYSSERIIFHGYLEKAALKEILQRSWIFCMPSSSETLGMTVLEAMYFGAAPIYTRGETVPELFTEEESGVTVTLKKRGDVYYAATEDIEKQLLRLLEDKVFRSKISYGAYRVATENYSLDSMCGEILDIYQA